MYPHPHTTCNYMHSMAIKIILNNAYRIYIFKKDSKGQVIHSLKVYPKYDCAQEWSYMDLFLAYRTVTV